MGSLLVDTLPYALAAALAAPIVAVVTAIILAKADPPLPTAWAFTAGAAALDAIVATVLLVVFWGGSDSAAGDVGAVIDIVVGLLFIGLGVSAIFQKDSPEKDLARRERIEGFISGRGLRGAVVLGIIAQVINFDALAVFSAGLKEIVADDPTVGQAALTVVVMLVVMLVPYYGPAVYYAASPDRAGPALGRMSDWLLSHSRVLEIVVGIGYGAVFLGKGVTAL